MTCANTQNDDQNCGACGTVCGTDQVCAGGMCTFMCTGTTTECSAPLAMDGGTLRYCADLMTDRANCGACGNACQEGYACMAGRCHIRCASELLTGAKLQVAFVPQIDTHRGIKKVRLRMRDLAVPGVPAAQPSLLSQRSTPSQ